MTLTATAFYTRSAIKYGTLLVIFIILARIFWGFGYAIYLRVFPPPPPPPTVAYGRMPKLIYTPKEYKYSFTLETTTGELPKLPSQAYVLLMPKNSVSFLDLDEATKTARALGFNTIGIPLSETIYRFEKPDVPSYLDINIVNKTFSVNYRLKESPELLNTRPRSTDEALSAAKELLSQARLYTPDLATGTTSFEFLKVEPPKLNSALSLSDANFVRVNFFRKSYGELPVVTAAKKSGNVWFIISGSQSRGNQIIAGEYHYFPVDENKKSTYPLKSAQDAWNELISGKGYLAQESTTSKVIVRRVYLAYYDSGQAQGFLQPVYVFEGDNEFVGYVPAITSQYYGSEEPKESTSSGKTSQ